MPTILITGFGPFPGAPYNPTIKLVRQLARLRRPALAGITIVTHVFETSYAAVDLDLPALIAKYKPDALLMFGLHGRARAIRIETRARNALALLPDVNGKVKRRGVIDGDAPSSLAMPIPARRLLAAARAVKIPALLSRDAGRYLCNYLCWRAQEASATGGPKLAAFVHVPLVRRYARPTARMTGRAAFFSVRPRESGDPESEKLDSRFRGNERKSGQRRRTKKARRFTADELFRVGQNVLTTLAAAVNRP